MKLIKVSNAKYIEDYIIALVFSDGLSVKKIATALCGTGSKLKQGFLEVSLNHLPETDGRSDGIVVLILPLNFYMN